MNPQNLEPKEYGWMNYKNTDILNPRFIASNVDMNLNELLKLIRCSYKSETPCKSNKYS